MHDTDQSVIVVGAGPGGLFLACELALAGVSCTVLERRGERSRESRATGLQARTLELLAMRGIVDRFLSRGHPHEYYRVSLGSARIDLRRLKTKYQQLNICPQSTTEELLEQRALELGATIERRHEVTGVREDADGVLVTVRNEDGESVRRAGWVAGFDGSRSTVRDSVGIGFPGKTYPYNVFVADTRLGSPPADGMLIEVSRHGLVVAIDYGDGWWRLGCVDHEPQRSPREPVTLEETRDTLTRIFGRDLQPYDMRSSSRFRFAKRQAVTYRLGRVLIGGDAAHVHAPLGAQGLNISLQDAMNLGWKLAAVAQGLAPDSLLDTYELERRPIGHRTLEVTDRAMSVMMSRLPPVRLLRRLAVPTVTSRNLTHDFLAGHISELALTYPPRAAGNGGRRVKGQQAELVGRPVPDVAVNYADGSSGRLFDLFSDGRFVFIDQAGGRFTDACLPWSSQVAVVAGQADDPALGRFGGLLCRPDGYFGWAGDSPDSFSLREALRTWCGVPSAMTGAGA